MIPGQPSDSPLGPNSLAQHFTEVLSRTWKASGALGFLIGFISDIFQKLAPFALVIFQVSIGALAVFGVLSLIRIVRGWSLPLSIVSLSMMVFTGIVVSLQKNVEGSEDRGLMAQAPGVGEKVVSLQNGVVQRMFESMEEKMEEIQAATGEINDKLDQQSEMLEAIQASASSNNAVTKQLLQTILAKLDEQRKGASDPAELEEIHRRQEQTLASVGELVHFIERGLNDEQSTFVQQQALRRLANPDHGIESALTFLDQVKRQIEREARPWSEDASKSLSHRDRALEPLLLEAKLHELNLDFGQQEAALRNLEKQARNWSRARKELGQFYLSRANYAEAEVHLLAALDLARTEEDAVAQASSLNLLAKLYLANHQLDDAEASANEALALWESFPDQGAEARRAQSLNLLGQVHRHRGEPSFPEAVQFYHAALEIRRAMVAEQEQAGTPPILGNGAKRDLAHTLSNLGELGAARGDFAGAQAMHEEALKLRKSLREDGGDPDVAESLNNLAAIYRRTGRLEDAAAHFEQALEIDGRVKGPDHPDVASICNNLGLLYRTMDDYAKAEAYYQRAREIRAKSLPNHPKLANTLFNLAEVLGLQGRGEQAVPLHEEALRIRAAIAYEKTDILPNLARSLDQVAAIDFQRGDFEKAEARWLQSLPIHLEVAGDIGRAGTACFWLAQATARRGKNALAAEHYERAIAHFARAKDGKSLDLAGSRYVRFLMQQGTGQAESVAKVKGLIQAARAQPAPKDQNHQTLPVQRATQPPTQPNQTP